MAVLTVSQLNFYIKSLFDDDSKLSSVYLKGEISNFTDHYRTGHMYMSLKDERSVIKAVMFAGNASRLKFRPEDGLKVLVRGYVSVYQATGQYQFYIEDMQPDGVGALSLAYEQLKTKRIGVITSPTGEAVQDICRILARRYPLGEIIMCPVLVQGENAAAQLTKAVRRFDRLMCADVIIIGRGGGSIEELWAFNDEGLARAIYECRIPIVSGVGHETDYTICDFAADVRASTPSAAAELVSPEDGELIGNLNYYRQKLTDEIRAFIRDSKNRLDSIASSRMLSDRTEFIRNKQMRLDMISKSMDSSYKHMLSEKKAELSAISSKLDAMSPLKVLSRGYTVVMRDKTAVSSAKDIRMGDRIDIMFSDGKIKCTVNERSVLNETN